MVDEGPRVETWWYGQGEEELCKILQDLLKAELFLPVLIFLMAFSRQASNPQRKHAYFSYCQFTFNDFRAAPGQTMILISV